MIIPFKTETALVLRVVRDIKALGDLTFGTIAKLNFDLSDEQMAILTIDWRKRILRVSGPFSRDQVGIAMLGLVRKYETMTEFVFACGDPDNEVVVNLCVK